MGAGDGAGDLHENAREKMGCGRRNAIHKRICGTQVGLRRKLWNHAKCAEANSMKNNLQE